MLELEGMEPTLNTRSREIVGGRGISAHRGKGRGREMRVNLSFCSHFSSCSGRKGRFVKVSDETGIKESMGAKMAGLTARNSGIKKRRAGGVTIPLFPSH